MRFSGCGVDDGRGWRSPSRQGCGRWPSRAAPENCAVVPCGSRGERSAAAVGERDALLWRGSEALIVWGRDGMAAR